jgi:hypothetical protein
MIRGFLLDENLPTWWRGEIERLQPHLTVWRIGDPGVPPTATPDPAIIEWCETNQFVLISNNRASMPEHLAAHVGRGRHVPGIFMVPPTRTISDVAEVLALIEGASLEDEHADQIQYLPQVN